MALIGYSWVSGDAEAAEVQLEALERAGCDPVFEDLAIGAKAERPRLAEAVAFARRGDVFVVWKLDRIGSSVAQLIQTVRTLEEKGVAFRSLTESLDTTASGGELVFHLFRALARFEEDRVRERTRPGRAAAKARGRKGGRKPSVTPDKLARARLHLQAGLTVREAAARIKVGKTALYNALASSDANPTE